MAPSSDATEAKNVVKDAMYLFDLFRESPQPVLVCRGPFRYLSPLRPTQPLVPTITLRIQINCQSVY